MVSLERARETYPEMGFGQCVWHGGARVAVAACGLREVRTVAGQAGATAGVVFMRRKPTKLHTLTACGLLCLVFC